MEVRENLRSDDMNKTQELMRDYLQEELRRTHQSLELCVKQLYKILKTEECSDLINRIQLLECNVDLVYEQSGEQ